MIKGLNYLVSISLPHSQAHRIIHIELWGMDNQIGIHLFREGLLLDRKLI